MKYRVRKGSISSNKFESIKQVWEIQVQDEKINMAIEHLKRIRVDNDDQFIFDVRKHISWYLKGLENCAEAKRKINTLSDYDEIIKLLEDLH